MKSNLHIHTTYSDGRKSIKEVIDLIEENKMTLFSITDHDNVDSCYYMETVETKARYINGVEISAYLDKDYLGDNRFNTAHLLVFGFDYKTIKKYLELWKEQRDQELLAFILKYNDENIEKLNVTQNRDNILCELVNHGKAKNKRHAFIYMSEATDYKVCIPTINEAFKAAKEAGGLIIWAHPYELINVTFKDEISFEQLCLIADAMIKLGLDGLEADYYFYDDKKKETLFSLIDEMNLSYTKGSDYHGRDTDVIHFDSIKRKNFLIKQKANRN